MQRWHGNGLMSGSARQNRGTAAAEDLRGTSEEILGEARRELDDRTVTDAVAVHEFRKAMKRWRAMLRLFEPLLGEEAARLRVEARDLARELAGPRDARAALDALADLGEDALSARTREAIQSRLEAIRTEAEATALTDEMRARLREAVDHAATVARHWPLDQMGFDQVADQLAAAYGRARRAIPADWSAATPEELHVLRQRVVVHRYQMELIVPLWPKMGRLWVNEAQKLRDRLGHHQDLTLLKGLTDPHRPLARWRSRLVPLIEERQAEHVAAARRLAGRLFAERPKALRRRLMNLWENRRAAASD
jgi:CHAD domain-containing protein